MPTVLLLRQLDAPFATVLVGFVLPRGYDPLLEKRGSDGGRVKCGVEIPCLEKVVVGLLR